MTQRVVHIDLVAGIDPVLALLFEEFTAVPPHGKVHYPAWVTVFYWTEVDSMTVCRHHPLADFSFYQAGSCFETEQLLPN